MKRTGRPRKRVLAKTPADVQSAVDHFFRTDVECYAKRSDGGLHGPYDFDITAHTVTCRSCRRQIDPFGWMLDIEANSMDSKDAWTRHRIVGERFESTPQRHHEARRMRGRRPLCQRSD